MDTYILMSRCSAKITDIPESTVSGVSYVVSKVKGKLSFKVGAAKYVT
jgi:hypothetical protein